MKKAYLSIATALLLAGCATPNQGVGLYQLETAPYLRAERKLPMDFVQIQRAVFKQQARCGLDLQFKVDQQHPSYARVTMPLAEGAGPEDWDKLLVLGLTLLQQSESKVLGVTLREGGDAITRARLYSYYTPGKDRVKALFDAILHPELCPGETPPEKPDDKADSGDH